MLARQAQPLAASRYLRRAFDLDPTPARGLALARSLNDLGRGREALDTVQRAIAGLTGLLPEAAEVIVRAADVAGLPSAQAEIDRGRLAAILGAAIELREGPLELPPGVRLSTNPVFRLDEAEINRVYAAEASCRSCSADLEELARQVPKGVRVLTLPPGDDQDKALRQVLDLYRRPWPLLLGRTVATSLALPPRSLLIVARGGWTQAVLERALRHRARHGARGGPAQGRPGDRAAGQLEPAPGRPHAAAEAARRCCPEGLAPGEDEPLPAEFAAAVAAFRAGRAVEAQKAVRRPRGARRRLAAAAGGAPQPRAVPRARGAARRGAPDPAAHRRQPLRGRHRPPAGDGRAGGEVG